MMRHRHVDAILLDMLKNSAEVAHNIIGNGLDTARKSVPCQII